MDRHLEEHMRMFDFMIEEDNRFHDMVNFYENEFTAEKEKIPFNKPGSNSSSSGIIRSATLFCEEIGGSSTQFQLQIEIDDNPLAHIFANILTGNNDYGESQSRFDIIGEAFLGSPYNCVMEKYWDRPELVTATGSRTLESRYIMPTNEGDIYMGISELKDLIILIQPWDKEEHMRMFDFMIEEDNRFHDMVNFYENEFTAEKEMTKPKHSPMSDSNDNDAPIIDANPVDTPVKTSKNGFRPIPISFNSQAILYLFPQKYHRGTAKVIHFYQKDICYILSGDEACHQNAFAHSCKPCIDYTPWSAMTYLPPDWCICLSDESDCSGYNACWPNLGYPVDLSYDGFKHIRSISILSGPVCKTYMKRLSRPLTPNIKSLECHPTRQNNVIGDGFDDYSMVQSPNLPSPYIRPNRNHMILQLFDGKWYTGNGTIFNFFQGDVCYNIKTCNIASPSSVVVYAPKCWAVCFSKDGDCKGLMTCWSNYKWPADLHYDGLAGLKSFAIYDQGCYEFSGSNITETRASKIAESCV